MRLIDADALDLEPDKYNTMNGVRFRGRGGGRTVSMVQNALKHMIDNAPTIDAAPVVHARWKTSSDDPDRLICSACGRRYDMYHFDQKDMPYCLCGAKMDAKEDKS